MSSLQKNYLQKIILPVILLFGFNNSYSQYISHYVITPFSNYYHNDIHNVQSTIGEPVVLTVTDSSTFYLTQGFQQPSLFKRPGKEDLVIGISVFPNPVENGDILKIKFLVHDFNDFTIRISNIVGKNFFISQVNDVFSGQVEEIDISGMPPGIYLVHVYSEKNEMEKITKIIKF